MKTTDTLSSLMFLADEPDERLYIDIANAIINYGEVPLPYLKKKLDETTDNFLVERLNVLVEIIERQSVVDRLKMWSREREYDLLEPYFILSKYKFPKADWNRIGFQTIMIIEQVENELNHELTPLEQVKILNHIIYDVNKFKGDIVALNNYNYYYVNTLFELA